jgi:hypothetical protein
MIAMIAVLALTAAGCEKANDLPRMQDEALATARSYQGRFDELARRAEAIRTDRLRTAAVQRVFEQARSTLARYRNDLKQVPILVQAGVKSANPEELLKLIDTMRERFEGGVIEASSELAAVESWIAMADREGDLQVAPAPASAEPATGGPPPEAPGSSATDR